MNSLFKLRSRIVCFRKALSYEINYCFRRFRPGQVLSILISLGGTVIINFGGTRAFFLDQNSLVPKEWTFLKDPTYVPIVSILVIIIPFLVSYIFEISVKSKEASELANVTRDTIVPATEHELDKLQGEITREFHLDGKVRLSIFVPVRVGLFNWHLQMVCKTSNIDDKELEASFCLNEGVLGYTFLKANKYHVEFLDVSEPTQLPSTYVPLRQDNQNLIEHHIKGVVVVAAFQENSIAGLLAIDTDKSTNLHKMRGKDLHSAALSWIIAKRKTVRIIWRMKNNV